jgi:hypothetical protein
VRDPFHPYSDLRGLTPEASEEGRILLGHADRLPAISMQQVPSDDKLSVLFDWRSRLGSADGFDEWQWSGWAVLSQSVWRGLLRENVDEGGLRDYLWANAERAEGDIRLSRNVMLHPSARLVPPVFIGENSEVEAGARVGPNVVISSDCVIDRYSSLRNSVVLGSTYVGERKELDGALVAHELVFRSLSSRPPLVDLAGWLMMPLAFCLLGAELWLLSWLFRLVAPETPSLDLVKLISGLPASAVTRVSPLVATRV